MKYILFLDILKREKNVMHISRILIYPFIIIIKCSMWLIVIIVSHSHGHTNPCASYYRSPSKGCSHTVKTIYWSTTIEIHVCGLSAHLPWFHRHDAPHPRCTPRKIATWDSAQTRKRIIFRTSVTRDSHVSDSPTKIDAQLFRVFHAILPAYWQNGRSRGSDRRR